MKLKPIPLLVIACLLVNGVFSHKTEDKMDQKEVDDRKLTADQVKMREQQEIL